MEDEQRARRKDPFYNRDCQSEIGLLSQGDAAQAELTAWTDLPMVDPDRRRSTETINNCVFLGCFRI